MYSPADVLVPALAASSMALSSFSRLALNSDWISSQQNWYISKTWYDNRVKFCHIRCTHIYKRHEIKPTSGNVTPLNILHFIPARSGLSGVGFQKNLKNWMQSTFGSFEMRADRFHSASRCNICECFSTVPSSHSLIPSCMWSIVTDEPKPPWILHTTFMYHMHYN